MGTRTASKLSRADIAAALSEEPLVGVTAAARRLGMKPPNFNRDAKPRLIEIAVEGSASVYFRSEVDELAQERAAARAARSNGHG